MKGYEGFTAHRPQIGGRRDFNLCIYLFSKFEVHCLYLQTCSGEEIFQTPDLLLSYSEGSKKEHQCDVVARKTLKNNIFRFITLITDVFYNDCLNFTLMK